MFGKQSCKKKKGSNLVFIVSNDPVFPLSHIVIVQVMEHEQCDESLCCFMLLNQYFAGVALQAINMSNHPTELQRKKKKKLYFPSEVLS